MGSIVSIVVTSLNVLAEIVDTSSSKLSYLNNYLENASILAKSSIKCEMKIIF